MVVDLNGKGVKFVETAPARGRQEGKKLYFRLCASPSLSVPGYRPVNRNEVFEQREVRVNENGEGEAVISEKITKRGEDGIFKKLSNAEFVINGSGGKEVGTNNPYVAYGGYDKTTPPPTPTPTPTPHDPQIPSGKPSGGIVGGGNTGSNPPSTPPQDPKDKIKRRIIGGILVIPVIIPIAIGLRSCGDRQKDPTDPTDPTAVVETTGPDDKHKYEIRGVVPIIDPDPIPPAPVIDNSELNTIINIYGSNDFTPRISTLSRACFDNADGIRYDIENFMDGDKDQNIKEQLGDEYVGISSTDGTPSSFHKAITEKYLKFSDEEKSMIDTVESVRNISLMSNDELKQELNDKGISYNSNTSTLDLKLMLIQQRTGIDMHDPSQLSKFNETFEEYVNKQISLEEEVKGLYEHHRDTTEKSIPNRDEDGKETYKFEAEVHERSAREEGDNKKRDEKYLGSLSRVNTIISTKQNMIYAQRVAQTNETISRDINGIKVNEEFTPSEEVYETIQNTQEEYER